MKLTKKHIGKLVTNGDDGSWVYQVVDVKKGYILFYGFGSSAVGEDPYYKEQVGKWDDWHLFIPRKLWPKKWVQLGWKTAKEE